MVGLKKARETVESAAGKVTASAETIAKAIGVVAGIAVVALVVALVALAAGSRAGRVIDLKAIS